MITDTNMYDKEKIRFDEFILKLKALMKEYKVTLQAYDNYDGNDSYCGTEYMLESDFWSYNIYNLL